MPNIIMADKPSGSKLSGNWGEVYYEQITVASNSITNTNAAFELVSGLRSDTSGFVFAIRRVNSESPSPVTNEFGGMRVYDSSAAVRALRFRLNTWQETQIANNYDAAISEGSVFDVFSMKYNSL